MAALRTTWRENWRVAVAGAAGSIFLGLCFLTFSFGEGLRDLSYDLGFFFRADQPVEDVVLIYMDHDSHVVLRENKGSGWDRTRHAELLQRLRVAKPKAIVFDIWFLSPSDAAADKAFVEAVRACGNVAVGAIEVPEQRDGVTVGSQLAPPFRELEDSVATWGVVEAGGGNFRQHFSSLSGKPTLAWQVAAMVKSNPPPAFGSRGRPTLAANRWINYYGPPGFLTNYSYHEVWSNQVPSDAFSNKVVFIGGLYKVSYSGGKGTDDYATPYTRWTGEKSPGVEINATTCLNLLRRDWLRRLSPAGELLIVILLGAVFGVALALCRPLPALGWAALGIVAVASVSIVLVWQTLVWFPWMVVCTVQIPAAFAWSLLAHTQRLSREKEFLARQLAATPAAGAGQNPAGDKAANGPTLNKPAPGLSSFFNSPGVAFGQRAMPPPEGEAPPAIPDHTLLRRIGRGSYGEVWLARDIIGTYHAVKVIYRKTFEEAAPFDREFHGLKKFTPVSRSHPGFVHVLHVGRNDEGEYIYYVMELADDEERGQVIDPETYSPKNLAKELKKRTRLPLEECLALSLNLAAALNYLHEHQLIHRDIKPANIIFVDGAPKFADIGLVTDLAGTSRDVTCLGTQGYIAPEGPGTAAADVYSLGKVIYETGIGLDRSRFPELPTTLVAEAVSDGMFGLNKIILKACEHDIRKRYRSAAELHADLRRLQEKLQAPRKAKK